MMKEILCNKEIFSKKYIGLKCTIKKGATFFSFPEIPPDLDLYGLVRSTGTCSFDVSGKITGMYLGTEDYKSINTYFLVAFVDPTSINRIMIFKKSDVQIGGVIKSLLSYLYQAFSAITFRKKVVEC